MPGNMTFIPPNSTGKRLNAAGKRIHHIKGEYAGVGEFIGIDGEGININGEHRYALLGIGDEYITDNLGITWDQAFEFIYSFQKRRLAMCGFFLGYDFNQLFKTLPEDRARMLLTPAGRAARQPRQNAKSPMPFPVRYQNWEFDILGMKRLKLRPKVCDCEFQRGKPACKCDKPPWFYVCDTGPFFQQSLLAVIDPKSWKEPIVTPEEFAIIEEGKRKRAAATCVDNDMIRYNQMENEILCRALNSLDKGFKEMGVILPASKWFGPGQVAQAWLRGNAVKTRKDLIERLAITPVMTTGNILSLDQMKVSDIISKYWEAAKESYFGGWFETFMHGIIPGITYEYDINSAYPHIIAKLPCLEHGEYSSGNGIPKVAENELCLVRARVWTRSNLNGFVPNKYIGAMLHREKDGSILRPSITEGWFWWHELQAAIKAKCVQPFSRNVVSNVHPICYEWVKYKPCDCPPPMKKVIDLYLLRQKVGKDTPLGKGAKTGYNSMYGKFAQSVGSPIFGNAIYASLITAGCRTMILNAIATHPIGKKDVVMVATDAVYFIHKHPSLDIGEGLGQWGYKEKKNLCVFKPGVYWDDKARKAIKNGDKPSFKARGVNARDFAREIFNIDAQFASWNGAEPPPIIGRNDDWPKVTFPIDFSLTSCSQALEWGRWNDAGMVDNSREVTQNSNPHLKRRHAYFDSEYGVYRSEPITYWPEIGENENDEWYQNCLNIPYEKRFGLEDPFSIESKEAFGISPDGNIADLFAFTLKAANEE